MTYGFEAEFFLKDAAGAAVMVVPDRFPRDASQHQIEVRSNWFRDPNVTLVSFQSKNDRLTRLLQREDLWMSTETFRIVLLDELERHTSKVVTAGFHIHFGTERLVDMPLIIKRLDEAFEDEIMKAGRQFGDYRMKPHGFEYRSLPNMVIPSEVADFLVELDLHV